MTDPHATGSRAAEGMVSDSPYASTDLSWHAYHKAKKQPCSPSCPYCPSGDSMPGSRAATRGHAVTIYVPDHATKAEAEYWRGEAERFRNVLEWLEENYPAAIDLCPFKAPTKEDSAPRLSPLAQNALREIEAAERELDDD